MFDPEDVPSAFIEPMTIVSFAVALRRLMSMREVMIPTAAWKGLEGSTELLRFNAG